MDGFDDRESAQLPEKCVNDQGDGLIIPNEGVCGTQCYRDESVGDGLVYGWDTTSFRCQFGLAFNHDGSTEARLAQIGNKGEGIMAFVNVAPGGNDLTFWTGPNTTLGDLRHTAVGAIPTGVYTYIEYQFVIDAVVGEVHGYINGVNIFSITGIDTTNSFSPTDEPGTYHIFCVGNQCIDDIYVMDGIGAAPTNATVPIGPAHVIQAFPSGDGDARGWVPSAGSSHAEMVDEVPPDKDGTYVKSNQEGAADLFEFDDIVIASDVLYAVQRSISVNRDRTGHTEIAHLTKVGSGGIKENERWGVSHSDNYFYDTEIDTLQPNGTPWTIAAFNNSQFGMRHYNSKSASS